MNLVDVLVVLVAFVVLPAAYIWLGYWYSKSIR